MLDTLTPLRVLAEGGEGTVWLAWDPALSRWLAVKIVRLADPARAGELLARLATAAREYGEPAVAPVLASGRAEAATAQARARFRIGDGPALYVVMPYLHGLPASELARGPLDARVAAALMAELCGLLGRLHVNKLAHLDLKPSNVFVDVNGRSWLLDVHLGTMRGSRGYAAPEQEALEGEPAPGGPESNVRWQFAVDRYALGRTIGALWTGATPKTSAEPLPDFPEPGVTLSGPQRLAHQRLAEILESLTQPDPARRGTVSEPDAERIARDLGVENLRATLAQAVAQSPFSGKLGEIGKAMAAHVAEERPAAQPPTPGERAVARARSSLRQPMLGLIFGAVFVAAGWAVWWVGWPQHRSTLDEPRLAKADAPSPAPQNGASTSCSLGTILDPKLVRFLCPGEKPRPGRGMLIVRVEGPSSSPTDLELVENPGHPIWKVDDPPKHAGTRLELAGPHYYVSHTPTANGILPDRHYIDGKGPSQLTPAQLADRLVPVLTIDGEAEFAPLAPIPDWNELQKKEPGRVVRQGPRSVRVPTKLLDGPVSLVDVTLSGHGALTWNATPDPCAPPRTPMDPKEIDPQNPYDVPHGGALWACPEQGQSLTVDFEGYR
ncbi:MAG TPA: hypothetical protein VMB50_03555 [Myxococcales bacterium]|nr:hypothetical protein [Myxococcales bacterium]